MPPRAKFSGTEIVEAAFGIVRREGLDALTARALGERLGSSPRPIFTVFQGMEQVYDAVMERARELYSEYVARGLAQQEMPAFKGVGMEYIHFAVSEPKLFQILFMSEQREKPDIMVILPAIDGNYDGILSSVRESYSLDDDEDAKWLYRHLWVYTHGIAVLCATNMCAFTSEEISVMLTEVCQALLEKRGREGCDDRA